ncbi:TPA: hypothetical protein DDW35_08925 [Candidatus Sumerlaeota bacterium]|jgi:hypothetical protein|nr:hypothetical protein [Candidatus Sumerlaeota bacterium]
MERLEELQKAIPNFLEEYFPTEQSYAESLWASWESRIKEGEQTERKRNKPLRDTGKVNNKTTSIADRLSEMMLSEENSCEIFKSKLLTNTMYAALVVAMWTSMEFILKRIVCALGKNIFIHSTWSKADKFDLIEEFFQTKLYINISKIKEYHTINTIRFLNNAFKHNDGILATREKNVLKTLDSWNRDILNRERSQYVVNYSKLPIQKLAVGCNSFCLDLLNTISEKLKEFIAEDSKNEKT